MMILGSRGDLIDGFDRDEANERTGFVDILQYSNVRLNFNIGKANDSEPLTGSTRLKLSRIK
ncbi:MAG: hypothetical protein IPJ74_25510 [Saprospiraceae bacterium]|nr:hypothetical protein [Saprospiraceae bacterium]